MTRWSQTILITLLLLKHLTYVKKELQGTFGLNKWWFISINKQVKTCQDILCTLESKKISLMISKIMQRQSSADPAPSDHVILTHTVLNCQPVSKTNSITNPAENKWTKLRVDLRKKFKTAQTQFHWCSLPTFYLQGVIIIMRKKEKKIIFTSATLICSLINWWSDTRKFWHSSAHVLIMY